MARRVFGIGETVLDIMFKGAQPIASKAGGSVLNAMISLARTGHDVQFVSELGDDAIGDLIIEFLQTNKVGQRYVTRYALGQTPLAFAFLDRKNDATYEFYKPYPEQRSFILPTGITADDIVLFGSFFAINPQVRPFVKEFIETARQAGAIIVYDPNFRSHLKEPETIDTIKENMSLATIVRGSDEDFANIFGTTNPAEVYKQAKGYCANLIITANAKGVDVFTPHLHTHTDTDPIDPISTVGAGDNFNAGIIKALIDQNITPSQINNLTEEQWQLIAAYGKAFAKSVCLSIDNYVDNGFVERLPYMVHQKALSYEWKWGTEE